MKKKIFFENISKIFISYFSEFHNKANKNAVVLIIISIFFKC